MTAMTDNANERLYTWYYPYDTCRYADDDGVGHFVCLDYAPPEHGGECFGPIGDKGLCRQVFRGIGRVMLYDNIRHCGGVR